MTPRPTATISRRHPFIRRCRDLAIGHGAADEVLLDGLHLVEDALAAGLPFVGLVADERGAALARRVADAGGPAFLGSPDLVATASPVKSSSGIVAIARWSTREPTSLITAASPVLVGLVGIQDPGNVGGIIRSAEALGATGVLALDGTAHPGGWRALRGAMGSTFRVPIGLGSAAQLIPAARALGLTVVSTVADGGTPLDRVELQAPLLLLVGNEGAGLPLPVADAADLHVTIPMRAGVNSLNVGVSAALLLWEARGRHGSTQGSS